LTTLGSARSTAATVASRRISGSAASTRASCMANSRAQKEITGFTRMQNLIAVMSNSQPFEFTMIQQAKERIDSQKNPVH
jgi:hypothetical protein